MENFKYLKHSYQRRLNTVLFINVALFWVAIVSHSDISTLPDLFKSLSVKDGIAGLLTPIVAFILDGLLSADTKARIVYFRVRHPLPGSRAFSVHLFKEPRADPRRLTQIWGPFPNNPTEQNQLWYRIYITVENYIRVQEAHRAWLFSRDLTAYSIVFLFLFGPVALLSDTQWDVVSWYLLVLAVQFLATMTAARTYGVRLVRTVLAVASQAPVGHRRSSSATRTGTEEV